MKYPVLFASAAALAGLATPVQAQEEQATPPFTIGEPADEEGTEEADFSDLDEDEALEALRAEIEAEFGILSEFFKVEPLTVEQEARLPLAMDMTDRIFPEGTFGTVMRDAMDPMMSMMTAAVAGDPRTRLVAVTGVEAEELDDLSDEQAQEVLDIFDPRFADRTGKISELTVEMIGRLFDAIEPAYRDAMARALTTRFDDVELREALTQLDNPIVTKLARQSFLVQYDPQMVAVLEQLGPALLEVMPGMMEEFSEFEAEMADEGRNFTELSASERQRAARLLGKSESELDALAPVEDELEEEDIDESVI